ncbi:dehydratase [Croceicoccus estronivorus]|uniref:MaoC/PaaZ C-terminal domain-containing protein n=1 Tax=Croceicoccus estronivorus TaxID=1172626 RepID=UPI000832C92A|nr:MaoC/PaaZ C-terminal domain-containing protein [Croceicoccus estronivorus]OCC25608.1 dehydratase [Croceicoccus estronivorus]
MNTIRFDDIATLEALVSDEYGPWSKERLVTQDDITAFGELTDDMQWIHVDPERAAVESPLGCTIAHGFLVLSFLSALRKSDGIAIVGHGNALNYGIDRLRFVRPVPVGSRIHCRTRIENVLVKDGATMIDFGVAVHVVGQDKPCLVFSWKLLYRP